MKTRRGAHRRRRNGRGESEQGGERQSRLLCDGELSHFCKKGK